MKKYIAMLLCILCALSIRAQQSEAVNELQKIKEYYGGPELKHVTGQMILKNGSTGKQVDKVDFEYWVQDKNVLTRMSYIEILNNSNFYVMVNNKQKSIYARRQEEVQKKASSGLFDPETLNQLLSAKGATASVTKGSSVNKLSMSGLQNTRFSTVVISYGAMDHKIIAVHATVSEMPGNNEKLTLDIKYTGTEKTVTQKESPVFSESKYLGKNNKGNYTYTPTYQNYQKL